MLNTIGTVLAMLGAGMILFALTYVTLLVGAIVHAMAILMAGPIIDRFVKE